MRRALIIISKYSAQLTILKQLKCWCKRLLTM